MHRRQFLRLAGAILTAPSFASAAERRLSAAAVPGAPFTLGVASIDPTPTGIGLWTRLAPRPLEGGGLPRRPAELTWTVRRVGSGRIAARGTTIAWPELGHAVRVRVDGLDPGALHEYQFAYGPWHSRTGRFRTAPPADAATALRIGVVSCNNYEHGWFHAFRHLAGDEPDLVVHLGDYIYEKAARDDRFRRHLGEECISLTDYRRRYAQYRLDADLQDLHAAAAFAPIWDDHEVAGNWAADRDKYGTPPEIFALRRAAAFQAFAEAMPITGPTWQPGRELRIYRALDFGRDCALTLLDTRQYRSDQACGDRGGIAPCAEAMDAQRTMLGTAQERWLATRIAAVDHGRHLIAQQIPAFRMDTTPGDELGVSMDKWDGYPAARDRLDATLGAAPVAPLLLSGDVHAHFAAARHRADGTPWGAEFTTTSVASGGDGTTVDPRWAVMAAENPALRYHSKRRGYLLLDVAGHGVRGTFRVLDTVTRREHRCVDGARAELDADGTLSVTSLDPRTRGV